MRDGRKHDLWRAGSLSAYSAFWAIYLYNFSLCAFCLSPNPGKKNQSDFCCSLFRDQLARASLFSFKCTATLCPTLSLTLHRSVPWQLPKAFSFLPIQDIWLYIRSHFTSCIISPGQTASLAMKCIGISFGDRYLSFPSTNLLQKYLFVIVLWIRNAVVMNSSRS